MLEPTLPARITGIRVGLNSKIMVCRTVKPIVYTGIQPPIWCAVWMQMTAPMNTLNKATIPKLWRPMAFISSSKRRRKTDPFSGRRMTLRMNEAYLPMWKNKPMGRRYKLTSRP